MFDDEDDVPGITEDDAIPTPFNPSERCDRITVLLNIHHETCEDQPKSVPLSETFRLHSQEDMVSRKLTLRAEEGWKGINLAWLTGVSLIAIENRVGYGLRMNPTEEEREAMERRSLLVRVGQGDKAQWIVKPKRFIVAEPADVTQVFLRAAEGVVTFNLHLFPF